MDGLSVAASVVGVASAGVQISIKVATLAGQISTASERVSAISNDVSLTAGILQQLGELIRQKNAEDTPSIFSKGGLETTKNSAETCHKVFQELEKETAKASEFLRGRKQKIGEKVKLSKIEKIKWPFLQPGLEILRNDLREAKGTLMLMLHVFVHLQFTNVLRNTDNTVGESGAF